MSRIIGGAFAALVVVGAFATLGVDGVIDLAKTGYHTVAEHLPTLTAQQEDTP